MRLVLKCKNLETFKDFEIRFLMKEDNRPAKNEEVTFHVVFNDG